MKRSRLFLWILGIIMQAFLVSIHFYQKNVEAMRTESEDLLVEVLKKELHRKQQELKSVLYFQSNSRYGSSDNSCYDK